MKEIEITNGLMRIETNTECFDMQKIENRRFMYNPQTGFLLLGVQIPGNNLISSHAEEFYNLGMRKNFDEYVRGWVGVGKGYEHGVIHFAPAVPTSVPKLFNKGYDTLLMFRKNNGNEKTVVRGFGKTWEQPLGNIIMEREVNMLADKENIAVDEPTGIPVNPIELTGKTQREKVVEITKKLEQGIKDLFESDKYKDYLTAMSKFHNYSFRNTLLIIMQKPDASMVAGYTSWQRNFKRSVKHGEKGIKIFSPAPYKTKRKIDVIDKNGNRTKEEQEVTIPAYKVATVFDVSQTEGEPLPELGVNELTGDVDNFKDFYAALEKLSPVPIAYENIESGAKGYFHNAEKRIAIQEGMSEVQTLKTLIHEIAHAKLHSYDDINKIPPEKCKDKRTKETEAESIAYTVSKRYNIDTSDYSFGYLAGWSSGKDLPELKSSLTAIQHTANEMISRIDEYFKTLEKDNSLDEFTELPEEYAEEAAKLFDEQSSKSDNTEHSENEIKEECSNAVTVKYYAINESAAKLANDVNSFSDYVSGSATAEYRSYVDAAVELAERQKKRVDVSFHAKIDVLVDTYARKLAENMNKSYTIEGRVPSILITGGGNFPTAKKEKQNNARDKNMSEWQDIQGLLDKIRSTGMGGISADDPNAIDRLEKKLAGLQELQEKMKAVNAYYRKNKTLDGCPDLTAEQIKQYKSAMESDWRSNPKPFEIWQLSNNNAEIRRLKGRIEDLKRHEATEYKGWEFDGGTVEANKDDNRLQIFFDDKPDEQTRSELKSNGFKWSPKAGAWQRQLTDNAFRAADYIKCIQPLDGSKPSMLQKQSKPSIREQLQAVKSEPSKPSPTREKEELSL